MFDLDRFTRAQDNDGAYERALGELRHGEKTSHWMWFVFPQIKGLGESMLARLFAIESLDEATAYLAHPVLGPRYEECVRVLNALEGRSAKQIFGGIDTMKLRSSLTLFHRADPQNEGFRAALKRYFDDRVDLATLERL